LRPSRLGPAEDFVAIPELKASRQFSEAI
jgi:hypothetical protein